MFHGPLLCRRERRSHSYLNPRIFPYSRVNLSTVSACSSFKYTIFFPCAYLYMDVPGMNAEDSPAYFSQIAWASGVVRYAAKRYATLGLRAPFGTPAWRPGAITGSIPSAKTERKSVV